MTASELMTAQPICVKSDSSIEEVADLFFAKRLQVAPVIGANQQPLGILTQMTLLKALINTMRGDQSPETLENIQNQLQSVTTVDHQAGIGAVFQKLVESPSNRVLVIKQGRVDGIISPMDLIGHLREKPHAGASKEFELKSQLQAIENNLFGMSEYLDVFPYLVMGLDFQYNVVFVNRLTTDALECRSDEVLSRSVYDFVKKSQYERIERALRYLHDDRFLADIAVELITPKGDEIQALMQGTAFRSSDSMIEFVLLFRHKDTDQFLELLNKDKN